MAASPWRPALRRRIPTAAAALCALLGFVDLLAVVSSVWHHRLATLLDLVPGVVDATTLGTAAAGVLFLLLADGLARRKRRAWSLAVVLLSTSLLVRLLLLPHLLWRGVELSAVAGALLVLLLAARREFEALPDQRSRRRDAVSVGSIAVAASAVAYVIVSERASALGLDLGPASRLGLSWLGLLGVPTEVDAGDAPPDDVAHFALLGVGAAVGVALAYLLLRSPAPAPRLDASDLAGMHTLLSAHGRRDSLGYFALRDDKSVIWSPSGKSCVAYRVVGGVALASGDPLGDPEAWPGAIHAFMGATRRNGWVPAVAGCSEDAARTWRREAGLNALEFGDEAVVRVEDLSLDGRAMRNVRQMVNRTVRSGHTVSVRRVREMREDELADLRRLATQWREGGTERGYSMALGRVGGAGDGECVIATATRDGAVWAFLQLVPWGDDGLSLDLMRRDPAADPGVNELLIVRVLQEAHRLGIERVSLNFAVFRSAFERGERIGASPVTRAWRRVLLLASRWSQLESLYRFNSKFRPDWEPRFILYGATRDVARVLVAYLRAEGFMPRPRLRRGGTVRAGTPRPHGADWTAGTASQRSV